MGSKSRLVRSISTSSGDDAKDVSSSLSGNPWWCLVGEAMGDTDIKDTVNGEGGVDTQGTRCDSGGGGESIHYCSPYRCLLMLGKMFLGRVMVMEHSEIKRWIKSCRNTLEFVVVLVGPTHYLMN